MYHILQKLISSLRPSSTNANLLQRVPPFVFYLFYVTYKTGRLQRVPPFNFFSALWIFFSKIFSFSKESPLRIFWYFATESMLMNPKGSPLFIFWHYATFSKFFSEKKFSKKFFKKIFKNFFVSSREKWFSNHIEHERHTLGVSKVFSKLFMNTSWAYLENWAFWALDIAPTLDVPVLLFQTLSSWCFPAIADACSSWESVLGCNSSSSSVVDGGASCQSVRNSEVWDLKTPFWWTSELFSKSFSLCDVMILFALFYLQWRKIYLNFKINCNCGFFFEFLLSSV